MPLPVAWNLASRTTRRGSRSRWSVARPVPAPHQGTRASSARPTGASLERCSFGSTPTNGRGAKGRTVSASWGSSSDGSPKGGTCSTTFPSDTAERTSTTSSLVRPARPRSTPRTSPGRSGLGPSHPSNGHPTEACRQRCSQEVACVTPPAAVVIPSTCARSSRSSRSNDDTTKPTHVARRQSAQSEVNGSTPP